MAQKTAKVEENSDLMRDLTSNAIINTNSNAYNVRLNQIAKEQLDLQQSADIENLKTDIADIKKLLKTLASK
jgi:hypothetical protein